MIRTSRTLRLALAGACVLALGGCVSVFPKSKPAILYRFGQTAPMAEVAAPTTGTVAVNKAIGAFQRESASDRLMTVTGDKVAYVAETRWAGPAAVLFDEALIAAFDRDNGPVRLLTRGEAGRPDYSLRVDVRNFEAHYDRGAKAAPLVVVRLRATLTRESDRTLMSEQFIEAQVRANDNRVGPIVSAYDQATGEVLQKLVNWSNATAR